MNAPFQATMSDSLRAVAGREDIDMMRDICQNAVDRIAADSEIAASLKVFQPGASVRRQLDIRPNGSSEVALKLFVGWLHSENCWHFYIEAGVEQVFEEHVIPQGAN